MSPTLTPVQEQVLASIVAGETATSAAAAAGIHRNTVGNWLRTSHPFRRALWRAQQMQKVYWREQAEQRGAAAFEAIDQILADSQAPAGVRSRLALAVINMASSTPEPAVEEWPAVPFPLPLPEPEKMHNSAQSPAVPFVRATPKIGRNEPCPCGSGKKTKHCCFSPAPPRPPQTMPQPSATPDGPQPTAA
jgi:SEC-C motif